MARHGEHNIAQKCDCKRFFRGPEHGSRRSGPASAPCFSARGGSNRNRTTDTRIFSRAKFRLGLPDSTSYRGVRCILYDNAQPCSTDSRKAHAQAGAGSGGTAQATGRCDPFIARSGACNQGPPYRGGAGSPGKRGHRGRLRSVITAEHVVDVAMPDAAAGLPVWRLGAMAGNLAVRLEIHRATRPRAPDLPGRARDAAREHDGGGKQYGT